MTRIALMVASILAMHLSGFAGDEEAPPESFSPDQRSHWAYRQVKRPEVPAVADSRWSNSPIDRFVFSATKELGLKHAPRADKIALMRRVTFDLTGLPPSPDDVRSFLEDRAPDAYARLVDRLLASPRYGERWAQHWLDLAHYADSNGFELDADRPDAWRYRDWVVKALNDDMPYDRFVTLQISGDEAENNSTDALIATGFCRAGPREEVSGNIDPAVKRQGELTEMTSTVGSVFLGLTMGCARCHDHKFDPLPTTDYYRLQSFFANSKLVDTPIDTKEAEERFKEEAKRIETESAPHRAAMAKLEAPYRKALREAKQKALTEAERAILAIPEKDRTPAQKKMAEGANKALNVTWEEVAAAVRPNPTDFAERERLKIAIDAIEKTRPQPPAKAMAIIDPGKDSPNTFVLRRGDVKTQGPKVRPRPPGILLASQGQDAFDSNNNGTDSTTGRRLALANWMTRRDNPLTSRVIVNRLWMHHFGRGIVASPSDFGVKGESPTHPELLDWLAMELMDNGWKLKHIHRLMVTSETYQQASRVTGDEFKKSRDDDPDNSFLWRMNRRRLDAEGVRDAMLVCSGRMNSKMGGPGVKVPIEKEVEDLIFTEAEVVDLWPETPDPSEHVRRSLYLYRKRNVRYPLFDAFDAPDTQTSCPQRGVSLNALQPLTTLNGQFALDCAKALAERTARESGAEQSARIIRTYEVVLSRRPNTKEEAEAVAFLYPPGNHSPEQIATRWVDFSLAMLNRAEFLFVP